MRKLPHMSLLVIAAFAGIPSASQAQQLEDRGNAAITSSLRLAPGTIARYRVTYFRSSTTTPALRSASVVSVTNHNSATCTVSIDWNFGAGGTVCTTTLAIAPGNQLDFCSRSIPGGTTVCNSTCPGAGLTAHEGSAIVGSSTTVGCDRIALSARTIYTSTTTDAPIDAITDAKVVRIGAGNSGD